MTHPWTWIRAMTLLYALAHLLRLITRHRFLPPPRNHAQRAANLDGLAAAIAAEEAAIREAREKLRTPR